MENEFFAHATIINLLLMFFLLLYTQKQIDKPFIVFIISCFLIGFAAEVLGTGTGYLFGDYTYGTVLGPKIFEVPVIIAINWFIVIYCCGITISDLLRKIDRIQKVDSSVLKSASLIIDSAMLAVFFDWIIEPVAVKLGYWTWKGEIPFLNYLSWFVISVILMSIFRFTVKDTSNKFAVNLLLIQMMFFLLLRTFL